MSKRYISLIFLIGFISCHLNEIDRSHIISAIQDGIDEKTGLVNNNLDLTHKAIFSLKTLGVNYVQASSICREISFELNTNINKAIIDINELLNCKLVIEDSSKAFIEKIQIDTLEGLLHKLQLESHFKLLDDAKIDIYHEKLSSFTSPNGVIQGGDSPLKNAALGLKILNLIASNTQNEEIIKLAVNSIKEVNSSIKKYFSVLRNNIGFFYDGKGNAFEKNSLLIESLLQVKNHDSFEDLHEVLQKILNYFLDFKYSYTNINNIYYLIKSLKNLDYPLLVLAKKEIDSSEDKHLTVKVLDSFGRDAGSVSLNVSYSITKEDSSSDENTENALTEIVVNTSSFDIDLTEKLAGVGKYIVEISTKSTKTANEVVVGKYTLKFSVINKVKINHIKLSLVNPVDKSDEKETIVEYPKRSFKSIKATQNTIIRLKVKLNFNENERSKLSQIFLKLRHSEYDKFFSAYSTEYKKIDDYHVISFDLGDSNLIDSYDGLYEMILVVSDISIEKAVSWNFGKIDIKFRKPFDPSTLNPSHKNIQKEKMEYYFNPEINNTNYLYSFGSCGLIGFLALYYLGYLKQLGINLSNFPKKSQKTAGLFSFAFIVGFLLIGYIFLLFWVKLNIMQTFFIFTVLSIPSALIGYQTLRLVKIDV